MNHTLLTSMPEGAINISQSYCRIRNKLKSDWLNAKFDSANFKRESGFPIPTRHFVFGYFRAMLDLFSEFPANSAASHLVTLRHVKKNITFDSIYLQLWLFISYFWTFNFFSVCEIWLIGFIVTLLKLLVQSHSKYYEVERLALLDRSSWGKYFESTNVHHV